MGFISERWKNSSIMTKISVVLMLLNSILMLMCTFTIFSWERALASAVGGSSGSVAGILFLIIFLYNALLTFGLFKLWGAARVVTIIQGAGSIIMVLLLFAGISIVMSYARAAVGNEVMDAAIQVQRASSGFINDLIGGILLSIIPPEVLVRIGFYAFIFTAPPVLQVLSMFTLFFCGKDYKKVEKKAA